MRPYRGLTKEGKSRVYGNLIVNNARESDGIHKAEPLRMYIRERDVAWISKPNDKCWTYFTFEVIPESVVQLVTKDKNGKDVYAGDRVKSGKRVLLIVWDEDQLQWKAKECGYLTPLCQWAISEQFELIVEDKDNEG